MAAASQAAPGDRAQKRAPLALERPKFDQGLTIFALGGGLIRFKKYNELID